MFIYLINMYYKFFKYDLSINHDMIFITTYHNS